MGAAPRGPPGRPRPSTGRSPRGQTKTERQHPPLRWRTRARAAGTQLERTRTRRRNARRARAACGAPH
eukprot:10839650-Lingulodinium_polyedra.AAC.1